MKTYKINNTGKSKVAASLAVQLEHGKAGQILVEAGFSQDTFCAFLAEFAIRAIKAGHDKSKLTTAFQMLAAGNASQARQACADLTIEIDGKTQSLGAYWGKADNGGAKPDLSLLGV